MAKKASHHLLYKSSSHIKTCSMCLCLPSWTVTLLPHFLAVWFLELFLFTCLAWPWPGWPGWPGSGQASISGGRPPAFRQTPLSTTLPPLPPALHVSSASSLSKPNVITCMAEACDDGSDDVMSCFLNDNDRGDSEYAWGKQAVCVAWEGRWWWWWWAWRDLLLPLASPNLLHCLYTLPPISFWDLPQLAFLLLLPLPLHGLCLHPPH